MFLRAPSPPPPGSHFSRSPSLERRRSPTTSASHMYSCKEPPPQPKPWSWRCSRCRILYRLGATTRCLHCGHRIGRPYTTIRGRIRKTVACEYYFDYTGWRDHMDWGRFVREVRAEQEQQREQRGRADTNGDVSTSESSKEVRVCVRDGHDCFWDCDYPSQCLEDC